MFATARSRLTCVLTTSRLTFGFCSSTPLWGLLNAAESAAGKALAGPPKKIKTPKNNPSKSKAKSPKKTATTPRGRRSAKSPKASTGGSGAGAGAGSDPDPGSPTTPLIRSSTAMSAGDVEDGDSPVLNPSASLVDATRQPHHFPSADKEGFKVAAWNVNGIRALLKKDKASLSSYMDAENLDCLVLNETKIDDSITDKFADVVPDAHVYWNCSVKKGYAGTAIISRTKPLSVIKGMGVDAHDEEGRILTAEYPNCYVCVTYVPNSGMKLDRLAYRTEAFDPAMLAFIKGLEKTKPVIWLGDLNVAHLEIDIHNPKTNRNKSPGFCDSERENFGKLLEAGLVDVWRARNPETVQYTYWSYRRSLKARNMGWRLDYVLVSQSIAGHVKSSFVRAAVEGSDHVPVGIDIVLPEAKVKGSNK